MYELLCSFFLIFFMFYVLREYRYKRGQKYFFNNIFKLSNEILTELTYVVKCQI